MVPRVQGNDRQWRAGKDGRLYSEGLPSRQSAHEFQHWPAFPALDTITEKSGLSLSQVQRCLKQLEQHGYISKEKKGRSNVYTLREKIQIEDGTGRPAAVATWDYLPSSVQQAVADLKNVLVTGDLAGAKVVHIERLQVNVTHLHDNAVNFNVQQFMADLEKLPPAYAEKIRAAFEASQRHKSGGEKL